MMVVVSQSDYDRGFNDGLRFVISCLRDAAAKVETITYAEFSRRTDGASPGGSTYRGVARTGQPHFAAQLKSVAAELEQTLTSQTQAPPDAAKP